MSLTETAASDISGSLTADSGCYVMYNYLRATTNSARLWSGHWQLLSWDILSKTVWSLAIHHFSVSKIVNVNNLESVSHFDPVPKSNAQFFYMYTYIWQFFRNDVSCQVVKDWILNVYMPMLTNRSYAHRAGRWSLRYFLKLHAILEKQGTAPDWCFLSSFFTYSVPKIFHFFCRL